MLKAGDAPLAMNAFSCPTIEVIGAPCPMNTEVPPEIVPLTTTKSRVGDSAPGTGCIEQNGCVLDPAVTAVSLQIADPDELLCT
jgi:hypothetical protein